MYKILIIEEKEQRKQEREQKAYNKNHKITEDGEILKLCNKHRLYFPLENEWLSCTEEYFYKNKSNKSDGLNTWCKRCTVQKAYEWKAENPEKFRIAELKMEAKQERILGNRKRSAQQRKEGKQAEWQRNNKDKINGYITNKLQHSTHNIIDKEWNSCKNYFNNCCAYCGLPITEHYRMYSGQLQKSDLHKEHVDHYGTNGLENCVPACLNCNSQKWEFTLDEFYNTENKNYTELRYNKILKWLHGDYKPFMIIKKERKLKVKKDNINF